VVRVAIQALAAVLGGTQSLHTNAFDEALALPTEQSATLALRTQQILAHETGVPEVVDPAGGSWYVEALTERIEREARALVDEVEGMGGAPRAIERGFFQQAIAQSAYAQQQAIEAGESVVVGVNEYTDDQAIPAVAAPDYPGLAAEQGKRVAALRGRRESGGVKRALRALDAAARDGAAPLMEPIIDAVRRGRRWGRSRTYSAASGGNTGRCKSRCKAGVKAGGTGVPPRRVFPFLQSSVAPSCSIWMAYSSIRASASSSSGMRGLPSAGSIPRPSCGWRTGAASPRRCDWSLPSSTRRPRRPCWTPWRRSRPGVCGRRRARPRCCAS